MNSELLGDILECSVCLKPLDEQNKVLPCQHTFCKSCLQSIVKSHKELRCPECRVIVRQKVDDLPSNILLIRLLDGIKNQTQIIKSFKPETRRHSIEGILSEPNPASGGAKDGGRVEASSILHERTGSEPASNKIKINSSRPHACALYSYKCEEPNDLNFEKGEIIYLLKQVDKNWMSGECNGKSGVFPINHVKILQPLPAERPYCVALYDFETDPQKPDRDCLQFAKNDRILVIRKVDDNWAEGVLKEKIGIFPLSFVKLSEEAQKLLEDTSSPISSEDQKGQRSGIVSAAARRISSKQGGKNTKKRHSFPTFQTVKTKDESATTSSYRHSVDFENASLSMDNSESQPKAESQPSIPVETAGAEDAAAKAELTKSISQKLDPLVPSRTVPLPSSFIAVQAVREGESKPNEKLKFTEKHEPGGHSATSLNALLSKGASSKIVTAAFTYKSQKPDELDLVKGDNYEVTEVCRDGWCRGCHLKSGKTGVFPGNYITPKPAILTLSKSFPSTPRSYEKTSPSYEAAPKTERTYKQFRQFQLKLLRDGSSSENGRPVTSLLLPPQSGPKPQKPTISSSKSSNAVLRTSPEPLPISSNKIRCNSANPSLSLEKRSPEARTPSKSPPPPRPAPPDTKLLSSRSPRPIPPRAEMTSSKHNRPILNHSTSFDSKTPSTSASFQREQAAKDRRQSEKDKKRKTVFPKSFFGASGSTKSKPQVSKSLSSPTSSPSASNRHQHHDRQMALQLLKKPIVKPLPRDRYYAIMNYPASDPEELDLKENDIVVVHSRRSDGWFKGSNLRSGLVGHFPSTFVERIPQ